LNNDAQPLIAPDRLRRPVNSNVMSTEDPTASELEKAGELNRARDWLEKDFDRARNAETAAINDFDKAIWLANAGAATVSIGFITSKGVLAPIQFYGASAFVLALVLLLVARFTAELNASRDRFRRQDASDRFFTKGLPISSLHAIRDTKFKTFKWLTLLLRYTAGILFVAGCIMTLAAFRPGA